MNFDYLIVKGCYKDACFIESKKKIDKYDYISFDMFDTLIKRDCYSPTEIFYYIEKRINKTFHVKSDFTNQRIKAEYLTSKSSKRGEITLDEIYDNLSLYVPNLDKRVIEKWEEECEYSFCQSNPLIKPVYDYCLRNNKKIVIITDMYLPQSCIERILKKSNIHYDKLFVSSTERMRKSKGKLFKYAINSLKIKKSQILHIGDNWRSDFFIPKCMGIEAIHISRQDKINLFINNKEYKNNHQYADLCHFINNHSMLHSWNILQCKNQKDYFSQVGYETEGPVLYGFIKWIEKQFKADHIDKVFFLARDGQIMQQAYEKLSMALPHTYMYVSRQSLNIPCLWMDADLNHFKYNMGWPWHLTIRSFIKRIGLDPHKFASYYSDAGLHLDKTYDWEYLLNSDDFLTIYEKYIKKVMVENSIAQYNNLLNYLRQLGFQGNVAIVDIGWIGHGQLALQKIISKSGIKANIHGYYLGLRADSSIRDKIDAKAYLFDKGFHEKIADAEDSFYCIVEALFAANHGTTWKYQEQEGKIIPVLKEWEYSNVAFKEEYKWIASAQNSAMAFVEDALNVPKEYQLSTDSYVNFLNWLQLGCYPTLQNVNCFGKLHLLDVVELHPFVVFKMEKFYLPGKQFILGLKKSIWRVGYLRYKMGGHVPVFKIYQIFRVIAKIFRVHA